MYSIIINNDLTATVGTKSVDFQFIYDSTSGKYGYKDGADTFHPFNDGSGGGATLIGTYTGTKTINVASYKKSGDTASNFLLEISSVNAISASYFYFTPSSNARCSKTALTVSKTLSGTSLKVTVSGGVITLVAESGQSATFTETVTYKVYHV